MTSLRDWLADISLPVYLLTMFFAVASWVDINGLWVEVPLLVTELPEGWALPSYLVIIIQVANIGPLTYTIANRLAPNKVREWPVIYGIIAVGAASCLLLAFFWRETTVIGGEEHSTALLALSTSLALVDCTSSVVFLPYMAAFKPQYMTAYYIGEGLSGLIPGLVGLAQGVGGDPICRNTSFVIHNDTTGENHTEWVVIPEYAPPNFSVEVFFFFLCGLIVLSGICFSFLHFSPMCRKEMINSDYSYDVSTETDLSDASTPEKGVPDPELDGDFSAEKIEIRPYRLVTPAAVTVETSNIHLTNHVVPTDRDDDGKDFSKPGLTRGQLVYLLVVTGWVNALTNGVLPSTQSYSALPYGNLAYTLSVRLGTVANPLACFLALLLPTSSLPAVGVLAGLGSVLAAYQLTLAAMSPTPPLQGEVMGDLLVILTFVVLTGLFSYTKVTVASLLQASGGRRALLWCGGVTQIGSFVGAIITFVLVNILKVFKDTYPCT